MRALYVSPMPYGANAAVDAICHGLESTLAAAGAELRVAYADFADPGWRELAARAVRAGADAGYDAIVVWVIDPVVPADAVAYARAQGVRVVSFERPRYPVEASVVYPNFNQGVYMMEYLAGLRPPGGRVAVVGGPDVIDDIELLAGIRHGLNATGLVTVNDPTMLGAVQALRDAGRLGEVKMVSRNGTPSAVQLVRDGIHHGTWDIDPPGIGSAVADLVLRSAAEDLDGLCVSSPVGRMITPARAAAWIPWPDRIEYHDLKPA